MGIAITLDRHKLDFFAIHEANYNILKDRGFKGYNIEYNTLHINSVISRTILLFKKGINFKRRYDIENIGISSIWVQAQISKKVSIMVCSYYCQWSLPSCFNIIPSLKVDFLLTRSIVLDITLFIRNVLYSIL